MVIKHKLFWKFILTFSLIILVTFAASRVASQITEQSGDILDVRSNVVDMSFFAGDDVTLKITSTDDVIAAGGTILSDTTTADHLILAGSEITIKNAITKDIFAAGGQIDLASGGTNDDVVLASGKINIRSRFDVGGSAVVSGGEVRIEAPIKTDLRSAGGNLYINSAIGGDAKLMGDTIELGPKTVIGGDLQYRTEQLKISPNAVITGTKPKLPVEEHEEFERWSKGGAMLFAFFALAFILGISLLVVVIAITVPGLMSRAAATIREKWLQSASIGLLIFFVGPFALTMLSATVIGMPLAMLIVAIPIAAMPVAFAASAYFVWMQGRRIISKQSDDTQQTNAERLLWPTLAVVIILLLGMIPFVGGLVWLAALIFGLGAIILGGGRSLNTTPDQ